MRKKIVIENISVEESINRLMSISKIIDPFVLLNSNKQANANVSKLYNAQYDFLAAFGKVSEILRGKEGAFDSLKAYSNQINDWLFGHFNYELYEDSENIKAPNRSAYAFPDLYFFNPIYVTYYHQNTLTIEYLPEYAEDSILKALSENDTRIIDGPYSETQIQLSCKVSPNAYLDSVERIKKQISLGNLYETNFCIEFYNDNVAIDPLIVYNQLNQLSPSPFSAYYRMGTNYLLCSSPERYLNKTGNRLVSQPIKGTLTSAEPKDVLKNDLKEQTENIMITDLVRNDLSRVAKKGTVKVDEQCEIYTFSKVHQMISTISCELDSVFHWVDAIKYTFPMGSMTGAPKISAIKICNDFEPSPRGIYSGALGYVTPNRDFDFNVIIRSVAYNQSKKYVSFHVGSAITSKSDPQKEYEECLLKANAMLEALNALIC